ncbi:TIGR00341 family protein [Prevotella nigrescens]|uniref:TIGR00341 family protein n=1 Tax=Prevotella nigrescens TaxID=28133 RepID=A0A9D5WVW0_9BACT|nr:TIGR00341 family protein [Prevotella nigrescens]MBF1446873.1 TIGR00341 family protein [Prevotella nigrescens]QUB55393.1 TIGR00341 family protein [Prevotella nigrescens F0103]
MQGDNTQTLWQVVKGYFNAFPEKDCEDEVVAQISDGVDFHGATLWVLIFAIFIASLGLNVNSTAVIIGAMLISPLMGPIIGMGLAVGIADLKLFKRALTNYLITTVISVVTATIYFTISPITEAQSELLARTSPTLYDVLIALFGGAAGILAISTKSKNNVIPGVAIATALMPPLCTAGYGLAVSNTSYFFGAFYLYFINTVFIAFTTCIGVRLLHFHRKKFVDREKMKRVNYYIAGILLITMIPAGYMTWRIIKQSVIENNIEKFVRDELDNSGTYIISHEYDSKTKTLNVVAIGKPISVGAIAKAQKSMADYKLGDYTLKVIQGASSDSLLAIQRNKKGLAVTGEGNSSKWQEQAYQNVALQKQLAAYTRYPVLANDMKRELKVVCPAAKSLVLSQSSECFLDTALTKGYVMAVVKTNNTLAKDDRQQLYEWLKARVKTDSLELIVLPQ